MTRWLIAGLAVAAAAAFAMGAKPDRVRDESGALTLTARFVRTPPRGLDDPVWRDTPAFDVPVAGRLELADATGRLATRALFTDHEVYFLFSWEDPTRSVTKASWRFDGSRWHHLEGDEDRLALLFEITRIDHFAARGCAVTCHSPPDLPRTQWKLATATPAEKGDLWHWKAARSAPYGCADDGWLTIAGNPSGSYRETGRRNDAGEGGDVKNETPDGTRPQWMPDPSRRPGVSGFLLPEEAVPIPDDAVFPPGAVIPYRLPVRPSGSRFDVKAESRHAAGRWTVMLHRRLDTGHEDDVVFDVRRRYGLAVAVFDDSGADHSKTTRSLVLSFKR